MPKRRAKKTAISETAEKKRQPYHLTCSNCRNKKTRCDGSQPQCKICEAYGDICTYDKAPPMSQITAMAERIRELENTIKRLRENAHDGTFLRTGLASSFPLDGISPEEQPNGNASGASLTSRGDTFASTSAVHGPSTDPSLSPSLVGETPGQATATAMRSRKWENLAVKNAAIYLGINEEKVAVLLRTHFTWAHPTFLFVYRPAFMRDMAAGGSYFSPLLLSSIALHSTRFIEKHLNQELHPRSRMLLGQEIHKEPSITTVQALLQLSAYESGKGAVSQAWLYSGMAFRMAIDLGLFGPSVNVPSDIHSQEVRKRLAWSCFLWDKAISLYLGRVPALPDPPLEELNVSDQSTELELWSPYYGPERGDDQSFIPSLAYTISNFANFCKLGIIINDILANIYGRRRLEDPAFVQQVHERLVSFRAGTPTHLKVEPNSLVSPPIHVLSQNLLYHTTLILLYRPFRASESYKEACRQAAGNVEELLLLLESTFSFSHVTYMMAYCAYTAATIAVEDWKENVPGSDNRVNTYLRALQALQESCPGIQRSIDIIMKNFSGPSKTIYPDDNNPSHSGGVMPAFPVNDFHFDSGPTLDTLDLDQALLPFSSLDSFPSFGLEIPENIFSLDTL